MQTKLVGEIEVVVTLTEELWIEAGRQSQFCT